MAVLFLVIFSCEWRQQNVIASEALGGEIEGKYASLVKHIDISRIAFKPHGYFSALEIFREIIRTHVLCVEVNEASLPMVELKFLLIIAALPVVTPFLSMKITHSLENAKRVFARNF